MNTLADIEPNWEWYRSFVSVLETGSLSAAGRALGLTQPTVGRHIDSLETALDLKLFTRSFEAVLDFIQFSLLFCSFFTVAGVIKLRITAPDLPRPYRAWGYPVTPLVFLLVTAFMMYYLLTERPGQSLSSMLIMLSGLLIYAIFRKRPDAAAATSNRT